jgi:hypothetical protein
VVVFSVKWAPPMPRGHSNCKHLIPIPMVMCDEYILHHREAKVGGVVYILQRASDLTFTGFYVRSTDDSKGFFDTFGFPLLSLVSSTF